MQTAASPVQTEVHELTDDGRVRCPVGAFLKQFLRELNGLSNTFDSVFLQLVLAEAGSGKTDSKQDRNPFSSPTLTFWSYGTQENIKHKDIVLAFVETYGGESFIFELAQDSSESL